MDVRSEGFEEEKDEYQPVYMSQEYFYWMLRRLAKENDEWCKYWVDQEILDWLRAIDKDEKTELAMRYLNQCHHPIIDVYMTGDEDINVEVTCPQCQSDKGELFGLYPKTAQAIRERMLKAKENELIESQL